MKIYIDFNTKLSQLFVLPNCTIRKLKESIVHKTRTPAARQIILYNDKILDDDKKTVTQCSIEEESILMVKVLAR